MACRNPSGSSGNPTCFTMKNEQVEAAIATVAAAAAAVGSEDAGSTLVSLSQSGVAHPCIHAPKHLSKNQLDVAINQKHIKTGRRDDEVGAASSGISQRRRQHQLFIAATEEAAAVGWEGASLTHAGPQNQAHTSHPFHTSTHPNQQRVSFDKKEKEKHQHYHQQQQGNISGIKAASRHKKKNKQTKNRAK